MSIGIIYARARNYCIGKDGNLPWQLPDEFELFEQITRGHPIIMGRKTFEEDEDPLPERLNIVVSGSRSTYPDGVVHAGTLEQAIAIASKNGDTAYIIGGAGLISRALPLASHVYESVIDADIDGDVYIDPFDFSGWRCRVLQEHAPDERHDYGFVSRRYERAQPREQLQET